MTLKSIFKLSLISLLLSSSGIFAADNSAVLGQWALDMSVQGNAVSVDLAITEDGNGLAGTWTGPAGTNTLSGVSFDGDSLSFSMQTQQGTMNVSFELDDNTLDGSLSTPMGDLPIVGKKSS
tara:strand:- start:269 stop:634 length:366 start_codon:yes stop_codon:yes gene_type:complete